MCPSKDITSGAITSLDPNPDRINILPCLYPSSCGCYTHLYSLVCDSCQRRETLAIYSKRNLKFKIFKYQTPFGKCDANCGSSGFGIYNIGTYCMSCLWEFNCKNHWSCCFILLRISAKVSENKPDRTKTQRLSKERFFSYSNCTNNLWHSYLVIHFAVTLNVKCTSAMLVTLQPTSNCAFSSSTILASPGHQIVGAEIFLASPTPLTPVATGCTPTAVLSLLSKLVTAALQIWSRQTESSNSWSIQWQNVSCKSLAWSPSQFTASTSMRAIDRSNAAALLSLFSPGPSLQVSGKRIWLQTCN